MRLSPKLRVEAGVLAIVAVVLVVLVLISGGSARVDPNGVIASLSCPSPSFCAAADGSGNALTFNGSSWSAPVLIDPTPLGEGTVSCDSALFCGAVEEGAKVAIFNRSKWSAALLIDKPMSITGISCSSSSSCAVVDEYGNVLTLTGTKLESTERHWPIGPVALNQ
jgi:hypothetical protein